MTDCRQNTPSTWPLIELRGSQKKGFETMNKIVSDWDTLPKDVKVMTIIGAVITILGSLSMVLNIEGAGGFIAVLFYIGFLGFIQLIFPGLISRAARARGGRMFKWYLFAYCLGVFFPIVGIVAVVVYYKYFWCEQHPVVSTTKERELVG
jgi:hypothetical protein